MENTAQETSLKRATSVDWQAAASKHEHDTDKFRTSTQRRNANRHVLHHSATQHSSQHLTAGVSMVFVHLSEMVQHVGFKSHGEF